MEAVDEWMWNPFPMGSNAPETPRAWDPQCGAEHSTLITAYISCSPEPGAKIRACQALCPFS